MDERLKPIIFDDYGQPKAAAIHVYTNTPGVQLTPLPGEDPVRTEPQLEQLDRAFEAGQVQGALAVGRLLPGAYRGYVLTRVVRPERAEQALAPYYRPGDGDE